MVDAAVVVDAINRSTGRAFQLAGRAEAGEVGAWFVLDELGARHVLKWWPDRPGAASERRGIRRRVEVLRRYGAPVPGTVLHGTVDGLVFDIQEGKPGSPVEQLNHPLIDELLDINAIGEGRALENEGSWKTFFVDNLTRGDSDWCVHETLRRHSDEGAEVLRRIVELGELAQDVELPSGDIVHFDFHQMNVLAEGDRVCAVIDCDGVRDGDRWFDIATLSFAADLTAAPPDVVARLRRLLTDHVAPDMLRIYRAHLVLRTADWFIRRPTPVAPYGERAVALGRELLFP